MVNAVAHRDYDLTGARVIIKRNPILMKVLSKVKYVEEVGEGWDRIIEEIKNHPLKPKEPKIDDTSLSVTVIIYSLEEFEFVDMDLKVVCGANKSDIQTSNLRSKLLYWMASEM